MHRSCRFASADRVCVLLKPYTFLVYLLSFRHRLDPSNRVWHRTSPMARRILASPRKSIRTSDIHKVICAIYCNGFWIDNAVADIVMALLWTSWRLCTSPINGSRKPHSTNGFNAHPRSVRSQFNKSFRYRAHQILDEGSLAYGTADGSVGCVKITQTLTINEDTFAFTPCYDISVQAEHEETLIYNSDIPTSITALRWVHPSGRHVRSSFIYTLHHIIYSFS